MLTFFGHVKLSFKGLVEGMTFKVAIASSSMETAANWAIWLQAGFQVNLWETNLFLLMSQSDHRGFFQLAFDQ